MSEFSRAERRRIERQTKRLVEKALVRCVTIEGCEKGKSPLTVREIIEGWSVIVSVAEHDGIGCWHASLKLHPTGRGSSREDWTMLGRILEAVISSTGLDTKLDDAVLLTPFETTHPNRAHHWHWHSDGSAVDEEAIESMKKALGMLFP